MKKSLLIVAATVFLVACNAVTGNNKTVSKKPVSLESTQWSLADQVKGKIPTLKIEQGKASGNAGCNNYFGELNWIAESQSFSVSKIGSTRKVCIEMEAENNFLKLLPQVTNYQIKNNQLELYKNDLLLLKFNKVE